MSRQFLSCGLDKFHAVVSSNCWPGGEIQGIEHSHGVCLVGQGGHLMPVRPASIRRLAAQGQAAAYLPAAKHEGDNPADHVLVHAGQRSRLYQQASLLGDFPAQAVNDLLAEFEDSPWRLPVAVIAPPDEQSPVPVVQHHGSDTD